MHRVWLRLGLVVLAAYAVTSVGLMQQPTYEASTLLWVDWQQQGQLKTLEYREPPSTQEIMSTIAIRSVAQEAIQRLKLRMAPNELLENLSVEQVENTSFIHLTYEDTDPERAKRIANTLSEVASEFASNRSSEFSLVVWEKAKDTTSPVSPRPYRNGLATLIVSLALAVVLTHGLPRSLAARTAQIASGLVEGSKVRVDQALAVVRTRLAGGRRAALREAEAIKEKELLLALGRCWKLTAVGASLETSLSVHEAERLLQELAAKGHLKVTVEHGRLLYALWEGDAPS